jgi:peroxiredoxin
MGHVRRIGSVPHRSLRLGSLVALAAALLAIGCSGESGDVSANEPLEMAPEFELPALDGGETVALSALRGKTVVVDFWATWCPPCEFQVPELNAFFEAHKDDPNLKVYGISIDDGEPEQVSKWVAEKNVRYPILLADDSLARKFGAMGFPTLIVIAPDGSIDSRHIGLIEQDDLESAVKRSSHRSKI